MAHSTTVHGSPGFTPHYLMFEQEVTLPMDVIFGGGGKKGAD